MIISVQSEVRNRSITWLKWNQAQPNIAGIQFNYIPTAQKKKKRRRQQQHIGTPRGKATQIGAKYSRQNNVLGGPNLIVFVTSCSPAPG